MIWYLLAAAPVVLLGGLAVFAAVVEAREWRTIGQPGQKRDRLYRATEIALGVPRAILEPLRRSGHHHR